MSQQQNRGEALSGAEWLRGAFAGAVATIPMTIFMFATQRFLPRGQRYDLPPEIITKELAQRARIRQHMNKAQILGATLVSHIGYGAVMGAVYSSMGRRKLAPVSGGLFGLLVWGVSYLGLLPMLGMSELGQREPGRRNLMMIVAHLIWGSSLGATAAVLTRR
jgi:uncharacterized membrane protein YagU involved in acid resistance